MPDIPNVDKINAARLHWVITPGASVLSPRPRVVLALTAGVIVIEDEAGVQIAYTVVQGQQLDFVPVKVLATGTSGQASGVATTATVAGWL